MVGEVMNDATLLALITTIGFYLSWRIGFKIGVLDGVEKTLEKLEKDKIITIDDKGEIKPGTSETS